MDPAAAKQQIAERVKQANKFLVTVNSNPTVDQLAACIGLTLMLNKLGKHATAVFSGKVPSTIEFLQPEKTLESNTDSLQDFIISLDKNKADKLRYKIEDQYVRIFITPYKTSLSEKDLIFSQGDFNVEAVLALGITDRAQIDAAITAHGRILHDATVISINAGPGKAPDLGQINWQDPGASSLSEMLVSISESFGSGLIDSQIATAFLTGIVSETIRFSNAKTTPKVMTMSAQLMAAGANQQLIASKLEPPSPEPPKPPKPPAPPPKPPVPKKPKGPQLKPEGVLDVAHDNKKQESGEIEVTPTEIHIDELGNLSASQAAAPAPPAQSVPAAPPPEPVQPLPEMPAEPVQPPPPAQPAPPAPSQAANRHVYLGPSNSAFATTAPVGQPDWAAPYDLVPMDPFSEAGGLNENAPSGRQVPLAATADKDSAVDEIGIGRTAPLVPQPKPSLVDSARGAVESAINSAPFDPAFAGPIAALNAQPLEPVPPVQPTSASYTDTPMLVLPSNAGGQMTTSQPQTPLPPIDQPVAPPPVPPPLTIAPGVVVPTSPQPPQ